MQVGQPARPTPVRYSCNNIQIDPKKDSYTPRICLELMLEAKPGDTPAHDDLINSFTASWCDPLTSLTEYRSDIRALQHLRLASLDIFFAIIHVNQFMLHHASDQQSTTSKTSL